MDLEPFFTKIFHHPRDSNSSFSRFQRLRHFLPLAFFGCPQKVQWRPRNASWRLVWLRQNDDDRQVGSKPEGRPEPSSPCRVAGVPWPALGSGRPWRSGATCRSWSFCLSQTRRQDAFQRSAGPRIHFLRFEEEAPLSRQVEPLCLKFELRGFEARSSISSF